MTFLLDTVAFLRALDGSIAQRTMRRIDRPGTELLISIVTPWEIALKRALQFRGMTNDRVQQGILDLQAKILPISMVHVERISALPQFVEHNDPFDRMLIAQALQERCPVVSNDTRFDLYRKFGLDVIWS